MRFNRNACKLSSARKNMHLAEENVQVGDDYLESEKHRNRLLGPFPPAAVLHVHINRFGVIPKSGQPRKWRLIVDLFHPNSKSVNSGMDPHLLMSRWIR